MKRCYHKRILCLAVIAALASGLRQPAAALATGRTFTLNVGKNASAIAAFRRALGTLGAQHLSGVRLRSAVTDRQGRFVEGFFDATDSGQAVSGVLLAGLSATAGGLVDRRALLPQTFPALMRQLASQLPRPTAAGSPLLPLHAVSFGSGTIGLPDGWQVANAYQGCVEATSQRDHAYLALGCAQHATVPPGLPGANPRADLMVPYGSPVSVFTRYASYPPPVGLGLQAVKIVEYQPVPSPMAGGQAAYVLFDYKVNGGAFRGFALCAVAPISQMDFMLYKSMFMTPAATFPQLGPTLWRSWQSWGVSSSVLNARLIAAAQSMRQSGDIITGAYWVRQHSNDQTALAFDEYIRDVESVENTQTGRQGEVGYLAGDALVAGNPSTYRLVPTSELQAP